MSPVIILGLVLMWAVVLVPMWLRRHDEVEESRSVDRFSSAMHTLSRHEGRPSQRNVHPSRESRVPDMHVHVSGASAPDAVAARRRRGLARRRARLLGVLALVAVAALGIAVAVGGVLIWAIEVMVDLSAITYFMHLRRVAIRAAAAKRRAAARRRGSVELKQLEQEISSTSPAPQWQEGVTVHRGPISTSAQPQVQTFTMPLGASEPAAGPAAEAIFDQYEAWDEESQSPAVASATSGATSRSASSDGFFDQESDLAVDEPLQPSFMETGPVRASRAVVEPEPELHIDLVEHEYSSTRAARAAAHAAAEAATVGGKPWEPVPVPKPTYATKPVAPSRPTYQAPREPLLPPIESAAELQGDDDLEAILDRRWAVND